MTKLTADAQGVFVIAATPFDATGALDLEGAARLIDFYLGRRVQGLTILGMMGEAPKLTEAEARRFALQVLRHVDGRVPVVVGVSAQGFDSMAALARPVIEAGAAADYDWMHVAKEVGEHL